MIEFSKSLLNEMEMLKPTFIQFVPHMFLLTNKRISLQNAKALNNYLGRVKQV